MGQTLARLLFPYFAPLAALALVAFAGLLATPATPGEGTGPAGSDVLGLYFIGGSLLWGVVLQLVVGLPLNALTSRLNRSWSRLTIRLVSVLIPVALFSPVLLESSAPPFEAALGIGVIASPFGLGACLAALTLKRSEPFRARPVTPPHGPERNGKGREDPP